MSLVIDGLRKRFGEVQALDGVSFEVQPGEVFGFLGANGAGKTTTMRIVLGLMRADEGTVAWNDRPARDWPRRTWGYMPEERGLYLRMPVLDQLVHFASLYGVAARRRARMRWPGSTGSGSRSTPTDGRRPCPRGTSRRSSTSPRSSRTLTCCSWTSRSWASTPSTSTQLKAAFLEMRDRGKALLFSTHQLEQAEELCDSVAIIDHGRIITAGTTREVKRSTGHQVVRVATGGDGDRDWLAGLPYVAVTGDRQDYVELRVDLGTDPQTVLKEAVSRGREVLRFEVGDPSLEEVFVEKVGRYRPRGTDARRGLGRPA